LSVIGRALKAGVARFPVLPTFLAKHILLGTSSASAHPSREEFAHGEKQAYEREDDKHDLVDMLLAGRQSAQKVRYPEDGIVPEGKPGPPFTAPVRDHGDHDTE
jgi:hypothetical protein